MALGSLICCKTQKTGGKRNPRVIRCGICQSESEANFSKELEVHRLVISNKKKKNRNCNCWLCKNQSHRSYNSTTSRERFVLGITGQADVLFEVSLLNEHKCKRSAEIWVFPSGKCRAITPCCSYLSFSVR